MPGAMNEPGIGVLRVICHHLTMDVESSSQSRVSPTPSPR